MILETIRQAIEESDLTRYRISLESGVDQGVLYRIVHGTGGCSVSTADALCEVLNLKLVKQE
jgi:hypothetical protein